MTPAQARELMDSWVIHIEAEHKSAGTVKTYTAGMEAYIRWCEREGLAVTLDQQSVKKFMAALFASGAKAATVLVTAEGCAPVLRVAAPRTGPSPACWL